MRKALKARAGWRRMRTATSLVYRVEIRGVKESGWKLLKDNVKERYLSWDTAAFPDGEYVLARHRVGFAQQPARSGAHRVFGQRSVLDRQHAAADRESHRRPPRPATNSKSAGALATRAAPSITPSIR